MLHELVVVVTTKKCDDLLHNMTGVVMVAHPLVVFHYLTGYENLLVDIDETQASLDDSAAVSVGRELDDEVLESTMELSLEVMVVIPLNIS